MSLLTIIGKRVAERLLTGAFINVVFALL